MIPELNGGTERIRPAHFRVSGSLCVRGRFDLGDEYRVVGELLSAELYQLARRFSA